MHPVKAVTALLIFFSMIIIVNADTTTNVTAKLEPVNVTSTVNVTTLSDKEILKTIKTRFGITEYPKPTLETNDTVVFVLFRFGAWDRIAYNNTKAVAPLYVYAYSKSSLVRVKYWTESGLNGTLNGSWGFLGTIGEKGLKETIYMKIKTSEGEYLLRIPLVKSIKEKKEGEVEIVYKRSVIIRHAQVAIVLAVFGILSAWAFKRKLLLLSPYNAINLTYVVLLTVIGGYYLECVREDSTFWLALVFTASEILTYHLIPVGKRVWFMQIHPSERRIVVEEGILYKCKEGLAYAIQSAGEAIKRLKGEHVLLKDKEIGKIGKFSEDKMFKVIFNEIDWCDAILTLSAKIRRLRHDKVEKTD